MQVASKPGVSCQNLRLMRLILTILDFIIAGSGIYKFINTTVCNIAPQVTTLNVDYNDATQFFNSSFPSFVNGSESWGAVDAPWIGEYAVSILARGLQVGQSTSGNAMGDTLSSFLAIIPPYPEVLNDVLVSDGSDEFVLDLLTQYSGVLYKGCSGIRYNGRLLKSV